MSRVLIAGMGNILRLDDGFGVEVARRLLRRQASPGSVLATPEVTVVEVGIGGIHLVQELLGGYDVLLVIDAVERGSAPGTLHVLQAEVADLAAWSEDERSDFLADMHYTTPSRAMILARALNVLPPQVYIVGCQPVETDELHIGLSEVVAAAIEQAVDLVEQLVGRAQRGVLNHG